MTVYAGDADDDDALRAFVDDFAGEHVDVEILDSQGWVNGLALVADQSQARPGADLRRRRPSFPRRSAASA